MRDHWDQQADAFLAELEAVSGIKTKGGREGVRSIQRLAKVTADGKAGPKETWPLLQRFPKARAKFNDLFPLAPECSWANAHYPVADDDQEHHYRTTSGFQWPGRDGNPDPETGKPTQTHHAQDITRRMPHGLSEPDSDGVWGAPRGARVLACLPGVVVDIDRRGKLWSVTLRHNVEGNEAYSYYLHIDDAAPGLHLGKVVAAGEFIAVMGTTGTDLRHLHFSFHDASLASDPWQPDQWFWLEATAINTGGKDWDHSEGAMAKWERCYWPLDAPAPVG